MSTTTFDQLGLPAELVAALGARRITEPFAIQALALPDALAGRDILGRAPTGSGKTLAFGLPALARLATADRAAKRRPRALILSPTRELAEQIHRELDPLAGAVERRVTAVYGGAAIGRQIKALARGVDLLVATPGRLLDLIDQGEVALADVELAIVDEADRMADMGFLPDVRRILDQTRSDRQTLLFSATLDGDVQALTDRYQSDPALHEIGDPEPDLSTVEHRFIEVAKTKRLAIAADLIADTGSTVVFVRTRHGVDRLARQLRQQGVKAGFIHGGRTQAQRSRALELFSDGKVDALVATDVAARGIHVDGVACVLHYDPPAETKDYVHRSGRTARAGAGGVVVSLLDPAQVKASRAMQRELGIEADPEAPPPPSDRPRRPVAHPKTGSAKAKGGSNKAKPGSVKAKPGSNKAKPGSNTAKPGSNKAKPGSNTAKPGSNTAKPGSNTAKPGSNTAKPGSAKAKPGSNKAKGRSATKATGSGRRRSADDEATAGRRAGEPARRKRAPKGGGGRAPSNGQRATDGDGRADESGHPRRRDKAAGPGKARAKRSASGPRATKRSGRPRPPNRKGKLGSKGRRGSGGSAERG